MSFANRPCTRATFGVEVEMLRGGVPRKKAATSFYPYGVKGHGKDICFANSLRGVSENMPRPPKVRRVESIPEVTYFKPPRVPLRDLEEVVVTVEEIEAIRLKDREGLDQRQGAERMRVSRPTFQRILTSAREKVAEALCCGKALRIEGGTYRVEGGGRGHGHGGPPGHGRRGKRQDKRGEV